MDNARQQIVDSIKAHTNVLVTVSTNPTVDELSAALALTVILNNQDKRASAVFSGATPPAINFLEPSKTFESHAESLRDFIIALDKEKADHLRYKVEGDVVKIFITPYRTTLSEKDLVFSQGDYNVELVVALGVKDQDHLDKALEAQGKILHDSTVITITTGEETSSLGSTNWHDSAASSLCEMIVSLADGLKGEGPILDQQIATALLTGIVSATDRFSNDHTTSKSMTMAAQLMAAGANQQLIASKLQEGHNIGQGAASAPAAKPADSQSSSKDGSELSIGHVDEPKKDDGAITHDAPALPPALPPAPVVDVEKAPEAVAETTEKTDQEFDKQLADLTGVTATGTMADIEKELQQAAEQKPKDTPADDSLTAVSDAAMPGFEAPELPTTPQATPAEPEAPAAESVLPPIPEITPEPAAAEPALAPALPPAPETPEIVTPEIPPLVSNSPLGDPVVTEPAQSTPAMPEVAAPALPPLPELPVSEPPQILNQHGALSTTPPSGVDATPPPINSIQNNMNDGEPTIDPFNAPINVEAAPSATAAPTLSTPPTIEPLSSPAPVAPALEVPDLPPLPPIPTVGGAPLPPPPPPPPVFQPGGPMPAGAVSGDIFGDGASAAGDNAPTTPPAGPATPPAGAPSEPGQFKIPGQ